MLKRIEVAQLRPGMYLQQLCGAWIDHPFWRSKFLLTDPADIEKLRASPIREVWIDVSRGLDVETTPPAPAASVPSAAPASAPKAVAASRAAPPSRPSAAGTAKAPATRAEAFAQARQVIGRSREAVESLFGEARLGRALDFETSRSLVADISSSVLASPGTLVSLARLKTQDSYTYLHSVAVCALMVSLGRQLGLPADVLREAGLAGLMHDLGKAVMPQDVLNKPGRLTEEEFAIIRTHPEAGHALLAEGGQVSSEVLDVCRHHHERIDGTGYPGRLQGEQISLLARMGAVCDVYDAITSNRPYKAGWDPGESLRQMARWSGHFDPQVFQAFVKTVGIYPIGTLVRLQSDRLAVVTEQNVDALLLPKVKAFYDLKSSRRIEPPFEIDLRAAKGSDKVLGVEPPEGWRFKDLDRLWAGDAAPLRP